ncbi:hypothetical protein M514_02180 [Trichuris suis]|uniref:EH domain-containing protein n=1 Tax=Trichuris suis TaxID=68888 RepID=A0A085MI77_9BILA|nr:hypothetical protein M513_02180 [Trichuris suis]KFD66165.1 hypothetical protein M514_02180 [Trichuris suis]KHJ47333.1 hypothetical protein D918_02193 [Trichuris suis]
MDNEAALSKASTDKEKAGNRVVVSFPVALHLHYINKVRPSEKLVPGSLLGHDPITDAEFGCPPCVLLVGEYSVGKTTMIQQFLKSDYAGSRIGEGPTTDAFFILLYGQEHKQVSAQYMINDNKFPYQSLKYLDERTLKRCYAVYLPALFLRYVTLVDSPGILPKSEEPPRDYEYDSVLNYFALKADSILFLFDARRPLVSDEVSTVLKKFHRFESKLLHIVNKVDSCNADELRLAFHKIASSLARISPSKTLPYLYAGSFWDQPMRHPVNYERLERDSYLLFRHLRYLTFKIHARRLDEVTCRAARIRAIALVAKESDHLKRRLSLRIFQKSYLKKQMDYVIYPMMLKRYPLNPADLPSARAMAHSLWWSFKSRKPMFNLAALRKLEDFLQNDLHRFIQVLSYCMSIHAYRPELKPPPPQKSVFTWKTVAWMASQLHWREIFQQLNPSQDTLDFKQIMPHIESTGTSKATIERIWRLSCTRHENMVDEDEFCLFLFLLELSKQSDWVPQELNEDMKPPKGHTRQSKQRGIEDDQSLNKHSEKSGKRSKRRKGIFSRRKKHKKRSSHHRRSHRSR